MARLFVRLKLRILANALNSSSRAKVSFVISTIFAVLFAAGGFTVLALLRGSASSVSMTAGLFTLLAFGWLILPLLAFGLDSTLDPAALSLYPVRTGPLAAGLLAASATGAWPAANVIGLLGVTVGLASGPLGLLVAVLAVLLEVLFCITLARLVTTGLAGLLRSRRGKDLAALAIIPIVACYELFTQVVPRLAASGQLTAASFDGPDRWLRWLPPGLAAHAIQDASQGRAGLALARLAVLAAVIAVLGLLWVRSLGRALVSPDSSTQSSSRVHGAGLPLASHGLRGAVMARCWIYQRRDPSSLVLWGIVVVIMAASSVSSIIGSQRHVGVLLLGAVLGTAFTGVFHANDIGASGPGFTVEATALDSTAALRAYFSGQDIALAAIAAPLLSGVAIGLSLLAGRPGYGGVGVAVVLAGLGAALGLANLYSVGLAYPTQKRAGNPRGSAAEGYGSSVFAGTIGSIFGVGLLTAPVIVAGLAGAGTDLTARLPVLIPAAALYGIGLAWAGLRLAAQAAGARLPELCQVAARTVL